MTAYLSASGYIASGHIHKHFSLSMSGFDVVDIRLWNKLRNKHLRHTITFAHHCIIFINSVLHQKVNEN